MVVLIKIILPFYQNFKRVSAEDMIFFTNYSFLPASPANITAKSLRFRPAGALPGTFRKRQLFPEYFLLTAGKSKIIVDFMH